MPARLHLVVPSIRPRNPIAGPLCQLSQLQQDIAQRAIAQAFAWQRMWLLAWLGDR